MPFYGVDNHCGLSMSPGRYKSGHCPRIRTEKYPCRTHRGRSVLCQDGVLLSLLDGAFGWALESLYKFILHCCYTATRLTLLRDPLRFLQGRRWGQLLVGQRYQPTKTVCFWATTMGK